MQVQTLPGPREPSFQTGLVGQSPRFPEHPRQLGASTRRFWGTVKSSPDQDAQVIMEAEDQTKKPYSSPTVKKLTPEQTVAAIARHDHCSTCKRREAPVNEIGEASEKRRHQRLELEVEVIVRTDSALLPGRTQDISEFGMSAILPVELREGQEVELQIKLPSATQTVRAIVRHHRQCAVAVSFA